jgi:hypothetical protein
LQKRRQATRQPVGNRCDPVLFEISARIMRVLSRLERSVIQIRIKTPPSVTLLLERTDAPFDPSDKQRAWQIKSNATRATGA